MNMAHAQQPQNGPINFATKFNPQNREQQQQQQQQLQAAGMAHSSPRDIFSSPGMPNEDIRRPSPSHLPNHNQNLAAMLPANQPQVPGMPNSASASASAQPRRPTTLAEYSDRANTLRTLIQAQETQVHGMQLQMNNQPGNGDLAKRLKMAAVDLKNKKDYYGKVVAAMQQSLSLMQGM
jgi:hypothetical protein